VLPSTRGCSNTGAGKNCEFMKRPGNLMRPGEKILIQCPFIHHESHIKFCKIQLHLYSQMTAPNYLTSGFNKIDTIKGRTHTDQTHHIKNVHSSNSHT